jgi:hypothetical protein
VRAPYRSDGPAGKVAVSGLLQALRLLEVLWIMSAMRSLSCVPRFLSLSALAIRSGQMAQDGRSLHEPFAPTWCARPGRAHVDADQDVFDGLRHDWVRPPRLDRAAWCLQPRRLYGGRQIVKRQSYNSPSRDAVGHTAPGKRARASGALIQAKSSSTASTAAARCARSLCDLIFERWNADRPSALGM